MADYKCARVWHAFSGNIACRAVLLYEGGHVVRTHITYLDFGQYTELRVLVCSLAILLVKSPTSPVCHREETDQVFAYCKKLAVMLTELRRWFLGYGDEPKPNDEQVNLRK